MSRRGFLRLTVGATAAAALRAGAATRAVRAALVVPRGHPDAPAVRRGAAFGATEASHLAALMGAEFSLEIVEAAGPSEAAAEGRRLAGEGLTVIGAVDAASCRALGAAIPGSLLELRTRRELTTNEEPAVRHLCVTPSWDDHVTVLLDGLRALGVVRAAFQPGAEVSPRRAALAGIEETASETAEIVFAAPRPEPSAKLLAGVTLAPGRGRVVPVGWHSSLRRYGAGELNERYRAATGEPMDERAWYGWIAVKLIVEAALRGSPVTASRIDGHKGRALRFAAGHLAQPLYALLQRDGEPEVLDA